eukprot:11802106-Heterocapsa_arctica.AAC.1
MCIRDSYAPTARDTLAHVPRSSLRTCALIAAVSREDRLQLRRGVVQSIFDPALHDADLAHKI